MHESVMTWVFTVLSMEDVKDKRVLEVGACNVNGSVRPLVEAMGPSLYLGIDREPGDGVDALVDAEDLAEFLPVADWDLVISTEMLEHVDHWAVCLAQMCEMLAPGGRLILTTRSVGFPYHPYPQDTWRYSMEGMSRLLQALGLDEVVVIPDPQAPGIFATALMPYTWAAGWNRPQEAEDLFQPASYGVTPMVDTSR